MADSNIPPAAMKSFQRAGALKGLVDAKTAEYQSFLMLGDEAHADAARQAAHDYLDGQMDAISLGVKHYEAGQK